MSALLVLIGLVVMQALAIPDLLSTGAVCSSWRPAYSAVRHVRLPITDASPCLLYSSEANDGASTATIYSPSSNIRFDVPLPDPPFRSRHVVGSGHGWIVAADELSNLQALNPLTGAQIDLPPVTALHHIQSFLDEKGGLMYDQPGNPGPLEYHPKRLRFHLYHRVFLSCSPSAGRKCIVLLAHSPGGQLSFARIGDDRWTPITRGESPDGDEGGCNSDAVYSKNDGLFYMVRDDASVFTLDLHGPSVVARKILPTMLGLGHAANQYIFLTPAGDIFQLRRCMEIQTVADPIPGFADQFDDDETGTGPYDAWRTRKMQLYKVDLDGQRLVRADSLENYNALFVGFGSTMLLSTKDFPGLRLECAYFTDHDNTDYEYIHIKEFNTRDIGVWNFKTANLETLIAGVLPCLNFTSPVWITPSLT